MRIQIKTFTYFTHQFVIYSLPYLIPLLWVKGFWRSRSKSTHCHCFPLVREIIDTKGIVLVSKIWDSSWGHTNLILFKFFSINLLFVKIFNHMNYLSTKCLQGVKIHYLLCISKQNQEDRSIAIFYCCYKR